MSLPPKKPPKPKRDRPPKPDRTSKSHEEKISRLSQRFSLPIAKEQTSQALFALEKIKSLREDAKAESPTMKRVLAGLQKATEDTILQKVGFSSGVRMAWFVARRLLPKFSNAEQVLDGLLEGNVRKVAAGALNLIFPGETVVHWILEEP